MVRHNVIFGQAKFNQHRQEVETVNTFIMTSRTLTEHCNCGTLRDEMIRDRILIGFIDAKLSEKLRPRVDTAKSNQTGAAKESRQNTTNPHAE